MLSLATHSARKSSLRALFVLGRVSNLPTVWSNCLAGWLLGGGGDWARLVLVCAGGSLLYIGGMYLNDAFDAQYDRQRRRERPIPSGAIAEKTVWQMGFIWLACGLGLVSALGKLAAAIALLLALTIVLYNAIHKLFAFSPILMAACRFYLVLLAAAAGSEGVTGLSLWSSLVLAVYIAGLSFVARRESTGIVVEYWPATFLFVPLVLAAIINVEEYRSRALIIGALLVLWTFRCLRLTFWMPQPRVGQTVGGLLAGIVLVDWLAVGPGAWSYGIYFVGLFILSLGLQRFVPAT